jgi:16S rRNA (cytosine1402-N4)-methyltransferase
MTDTIFHQSVLLKEAIEALNIRQNQPYLDCTLGSAGHAEEIIKKGGKLFGIDQDPMAVQRSKTRLDSSCPQAEFHLEAYNFNHLNKAAKHFKVKAFAGIIFDLGLSSEQLADPKKGLSFQSNAPLDMRTDPNLSVTAADLVNGLHKGELSELLNKYGQEQYHLAIANHIVVRRQREPIKTTGELADLVSQAKKQRGKTHPATQTFQALRIAVNDELNNLKKALPQAVKLLSSQGRLVIISFHSLEDKIVKNFFKGEKSIKIKTLKPITPSQEEIHSNPRSRSAKMRVAEKI